jgi:nucleotide-binding universal stress UspA family protein
MNILIAVDGSEFSDTAVQELIESQPRTVHIRVVNVVEPLPVVESWAYAVDWQQLLDDQRKEAESLVAAAAQRLRNAGFNDVTMAVEEGIAKSVLVEAASKWPADLVMMGSHGRRGLARFLIGSVSEGVSRFAPCSVEIVRKRLAA